MEYDINKWRPIIDMLGDSPMVAEFGVASGNNLEAILINLLRKEKGAAVYGFDSFEGLPNESGGVRTVDEWHVGAFNLIHEINKNRLYPEKAATTDQAIYLLMDRFSKYDDSTRIVFIRGFYSDSLSDELAATLTPFDLIHIDCDLYISSFQALDWLARNKLFAPGCIVRYDDWHSNNIAEGQFGESKAHFEIKDKYRLEFEEVLNEETAKTFRYKTNV